MKIMYKIHENAENGRFLLPKKNHEKIVKLFTFKLNSSELFHFDEIFVKLFSWKLSISMFRFSQFSSICIFGQEIEL